MSRYHSLPWSPSPWLRHFRTTVILQRLKTTLSGRPCVAEMQSHPQKDILYLLRRLLSSPNLGLLAHFDRIKSPSSLTSSPHYTHIFSALLPQTIVMKCSGITQVLNLLHFLRLLCDKTISPRDTQAPHLACAKVNITTPRPYVSPAFAALSQQELTLLSSA